jgi:hypothetical protein
MSRRPIASRNPEIQDLWQAGLKKIEILRRMGFSSSSTIAYFGAIDPTPQPLGCREPCGLAGETPEQRAYRRFPINSHKPSYNS